MRRPRPRSLLFLVLLLYIRRLESVSTLRKIVKAGGRVDVVCFGHSDEDFADVADRETAAERITAQAVQAHRLLGVSAFECFNYPDYGVQESREAYRLCIESIRKHQPDVIFAHYWAEYFQHRAMARMGCDSWWQAGWNCSADLGPPWNARALYHFEVIQMLPEPSDIVDISDTFEDKWLPGNASNRVRNSWRRAPRKGRVCAAITAPLWDPLQKSPAQPAGWHHGGRA